MMKTMPRKRIWCATLSDLSVKVQQLKLAELLRKSDIKYPIDGYNAVRGYTNKTIVARNNSVIYLKTYEQGAQSFQGDSIDLAWFDEEPPYDVFKETLIRLGDRNGIMLLTFTALMGFTSLINKIWGTDDPTVRQFKLTPYLNPFLSKEQKAQLRASIDSDEVTSRWEGDPCMKEGLIYKEFKDIHQIPRFDYVALAKGFPKRYQIHEGIDPHPRTPHHWLRFLYDSKEDILYVVDELKAAYESMLVRDFALIIKHKRGNSPPSYTQIDTSAETPDVINVHRDEYQEDAHTIRQEFFNNGIETVLCTKDNAVGIDAVKSRLKVVKNRQGEIKRKPKTYVFNDLPGFIAEVLRYAWDSYATSKSGEKKEMINRPLKKNDHFMDVWKYECIKLKHDWGLEDETVEEAMDLYSAMGY